MAEEKREEGNPSTNFPENPFSEQETATSDPESSDDKSRFPSVPVFKPHTPREYSLEQEGAHFGGRRAFGCRAKARGTLSMSSGSPMDPNIIGPESSPTDGISDGEQNVPTNCEASTQTDIFLPTWRDAMESEQPLQKEDEPSDQADNQKEESAGVSKETTPMVIIVKAKPKDEKECLFYPDCCTEDKQECEMPTQFPVKESIICEDTDKVRMLHYLYHRIDTPSVPSSETDCNNDCMASSFTTTLHSAHQTYPRKEFGNNFESFKFPHNERHQNAANCPDHVAISDFNELPISEEIRNLQRSKSCCDKEKTVNHPSVFKRFPCLPDFVVDPTHSEMLYYPRFRRRNLREDIFSLSKPEGEIIVEDISETAESTDTLESNDCLQDTSSPPSQEESKSEWTNIDNIDDRLSEDASIDSVSKNIQVLHHEMGNDSKNLQSKIFHGRFQRSENSGQKCCSRSQTKSHDGVSAQKEALDLKGAKLDNRSEGASPKKKTPRQKSTTTEYHTESDAPRKDKMIPQGKWVENLSDEVKCEKHATDNRKKKGKIQQMCKFVKDRFKGKH